ncbi:MAG: glycosyltransferase [Candidatus Omnitrophota bacterium]
MKNNQASRLCVAKGLIVAVFVFIIVYAIFRAVFVSFAQYSALEKSLAVVFLASELFIMFHAIGYFSGMYRLGCRVMAARAVAPPKGEHPSVAILVPARHEPRNVLEGTLACLYNLDYPEKHIYLLDDSSDERYKEEANELAEKYRCVLFRRKERHGAKAGIINDCLKGLDEKYVAVFDVDQNPMPSFLSKLVPLMEADPKLAFVQTPQFYSNTDASRIADSANTQQAIFYEYVCEGKSSGEAMICCGTNVLLRREALVSVGGFDEASVTEDFATSFRLQVKGWRTLYYNHVNTFGMGPENLGVYLSQQNRWAMGNVSVLGKILRTLFTRPFALTPLQWFEYFITSTYYLVGWAYLFLILCPVIYVLFGIPSFFMNPVVYSLTFMPYLILSIAIFYSTMGIRRYTPKSAFLAQALSFITIPVYMRAAAYGLLGIKSAFQVTKKGVSARIPYIRLWPQMLFLALNYTALVWGINKFIYGRTTAIIFNIVWLAYHCVLFSSIFYFNEEKGG